jgi:probable rRNA maturation factor
LSIEFSVEADVIGRWDEPRISALVASIVSRENVPAEYTIALHLVGSATIQKLNRAHRSRDSETDVLSFPLRDGSDFVTPPGEPVNLGDVVVSYPRAVEQATEYGHSVERELAYLVAHGVLHVLGYDHEDERERERMRQKEEEALQPLGFTR